MVAKKRVSSCAKAGIFFPITRFHRCLKQKLSRKRAVSRLAAVYISAVIEYVASEILLLSGNASKFARRRRISPRHIFLSIKHDAELDKLLASVLLPDAGVLPCVHPFLFPHKDIDHKNDSSKPKNARSSKPGKLNISKKSVILSEKILSLGQKLTVMQGDITTVKTDAIVHPTDSNLNTYGKIGKQLRQICKNDLVEEIEKLRAQNLKLGIGEVAVSEAPGLPCKHIIHVVSPKWDSSDVGGCITRLDTCVNNILHTCDNRNISTLAVPSIGSGNAGYPKQTAAETILHSINAYFKKTSGSKIKQVNFVLYDQESVDVYILELKRMQTN